MLFIILILIILFSKLVRFWVADTLYKRGSDYNDLGNPGRAYNYLLSATRLNPGEPLYRSDLAYAGAAAAVALQADDATTSARLKDEAVEENNLALGISPNNISLWRTAIRTDYLLSTIDQKFDDFTLQTVDKTISLAPTDPKLYYNKALILQQQKKVKEAVEVLQKTIQLKPNYREAHFTLGVFYEELGKKDQAIREMKIVLGLVPNDPDALAKLKELQSGK